jgi:hypothetical protein
MFLISKMQTKLERENKDPIPGSITVLRYSWEKYIWEPGPPGWGCLKFETVKYGH